MNPGEGVSEQRNYVDVYIALLLSHFLFLSLSVSLSPSVLSPQRE